VTETAYRMPPDLVNEDYETTWLRIDGPEDTRGKAKAAFASEWGVDFTGVRVTKEWFKPPEPECDECGERPATCGVEATWGDGGPSFTEKVCVPCQAAILAREGIFSRLSSAEPRTLEQVEPYDGWNVAHAKSGEPGAIAYWHGEAA
jgi:hypothetical protein